jgi:hypothetical protein
MPQPRRTISALQDNFFREFVGLSDVQIEDIRAEKAIAKVLESPTPDEVIVSALYTYIPLLSGVLTRKNAGT